MQIAINAGAYLAIVLLVSTAFFFQYRLFRYFDLSLGAVFLAGAYAFFFLTSLQVSSFVAAFSSVATAALVGLLFYLCLIRGLVKMEASSLAMTLCAFGFYIAGVNVIAMLFGDEVIRAPDSALSASVALGGGVASVSQLLEFVVAICSVGLVWIFLATGKLGRLFRAFGDNPKLANEIGLSSNLPILVVTAWGAALVGITGVLVVADVGVRPSAAFSYLIPGLAAVLIFGAKSIGDTVSGALVVASIGETSGYAFGQQWRDFAIYISVALILAARTSLLGINR